VSLNHGWYLAPKGAAGSEAIVYLPAFNDEVRNFYERKGYMLLSECAGDSARDGAPNVIRPPSDSVLRHVVRTLKERLDDNLAALSRAEAEIKEAIKDDLVEPWEKRVYRNKLRAIQRLRKELPQSIPTFAELKAYFLREYRMRIQAAQNPQVRRTLALHAQEQEIAAELTMLRHGGEEPEEEGEEAFAPA